MREPTYFVLAALLRGPLHGYAIMKRAEELSADGFPATAVHLDLSDHATIAGAAARLGTEFGRLDALVISSGAGAGGTVLEQSLERWNRVMATNLTGAFLVCWAALRHHPPDARSAAEMPMGHLPAQS